MKAAGYLQDVAMGSITAAGTSSITIKAQANLKSFAEDRIKEIDAEIENLKALQDKLGQYELYKPEGLNLNLQPYNPTGSTTTKPGGYTPSKGSSGSSSSKDKTEKEVEDLEFKKDLYHDINIELQKIANTMTKLQEQEDDLYGEAKIANMEKQAE